MRSIASVTVIVCTRDRPGLLEECLRALSGQTYPDFEVLVVDNAPSRLVRDICQRWRATWVAAPLPGLTRARNVGARMARGEVIAYIDDDAVAEAGWLAALMEDFGDPGIAAVTGRIRYMKSLGDTREISDQESAEDPPRPRRSLDARTRGWFATASFGGIGDGGNMAFRRELIASEAPFDERIGRGRLLDSGDEHVVFSALIAQGHRIVHNPDAVVRHPCPPTPALQRARRLSELRSSIAYLLFLWFEFGSHRGDILRFLARAVRKRVAPARDRRSGTASISLARAIAAMLGGLVLYCKATREWTGAPPRAGEAIAPLPRIAQRSSGSR